MAISYSDAMAMRDLMQREADTIINNSRPQPRYAKVVSIIPADRRCLVLFPGDNTPVSVSYGTMRPNAADQYVRVEGPPGNAFIADVMGDGYTESTLTALGTTVVNLDSLAVKTTGNQTINGVKTFGSIPVIPTSTPTSSGQATSKSYVDSKVSQDINAQRMLVNEFYTVNKPSFQHNTYTSIVWDASGVAEGGCSRSGATARIVVSKAGWWDVEGFIKYDYRASTGSKFCNILVENSAGSNTFTRFAGQDTVSYDGFTHINRKIYLATNKGIKLEGFQFTGSALEAEQGLASTAFVLTWLRA